MPATITAPPAEQPKDKSKAAALVVPFTRAAKEHIEAFVDVPNLLTATTVQLGPYDVPAYGYMRHLVITVDASGGVGGGATVAAAEDAPWSSIQEIALLDVNGAPIIGPFSGYDLFLLNKYGGYGNPSPDPRQSPYFSAVATGVGASGNFRFLLRVPVEVSARDGLGALPNQNAASTYKLRITQAPSSLVYTTAPATTLPTIRIRAHLEAWTQPTATDLRGNSNAQQPPAVGTTSYWSKTIINVPSGQQTIRLPRVGNYIRNLMFVYRDGAGSRATGAGLFPDPAVTMWDTKILESLPRDVWRHYMQQRYDFTAAAEAARGLDNGVFVRDFMHDFDGRAGYELRDGWLPTVQSTRLELQGNFTGAGVLTVLTNDVSPAGEIFV